MLQIEGSVFIFKREAPGICPVCPMVNPALVEYGTRSLSLLVALLYPVSLSHELALHSCARLY